MRITRNSGLSSFITRVANYSNFGNFIVSVAFMLMGVHAAMEGASKGGRRHRPTSPSGRRKTAASSSVRAGPRRASRAAVRGRAANAVDAKLGITRNLSAAVETSPPPGPRQASATRDLGPAGLRHRLDRRRVAAAGAWARWYYKTRMAENEKGWPRRSGQVAREQLRILMAQNALALNDEQRLAAQQQMHKHRHGRGPEGDEAGA